MSTTDRPPRRRTIRDAQKESTYQLLLESARDLFVEQGYRDTTIDQIAARAGASRATFYLHFDAKWRPIARLSEIEMVPEALAFYDRLNAYDDITRDDLREWLDAILDYYTKYQTLVMLSVQAMTTEPDYATSFYAFIPVLVDRLVNRVASMGDDRRAEGHLRLSLLIFQLNTFASEWVLGRWALERDTILDVFTDLWAGGLGLTDG